MRHYFKEGFIVAWGSLLYGIQLFRFPGILENYRVYQIVDDIMNNQHLGLLFIMFALTKIIGIFIKKPIMRRIGLIGLVFLWGMFSVSFMLSPPPNTVWTLSVTMLAVLIKASFNSEEA